MKEKQDEKTALRLRIENAALRSAWKSHNCFTAPSFCRKWEFEDTRYLRTILAEMVEAKDLHTFKEGKNKGGKRYYCANEKDMIAMFQEELL